MQFHLAPLSVTLDDLQMNIHKVSVDCMHLMFDSKHGPWVFTQINNQWHWEVITVATGAGTGGGGAGPYTTPPTLFLPPSLIQVFG